MLRFGEFVEEEDPDLGAARLVEDGQAEGDVDAGLEGLVEGADAVGGEEEDAVEVFERTEEDCKRCLAFTSGDLQGNAYWTREHSALGSHSRVPAGRHPLRRGPGSHPRSQHRQKSLPASPRGWKGECQSHHR